MENMCEVWVEFRDGSIAKYRFDEAELPAWLDRLRAAGVARGVWVDGHPRPLDAEDGTGKPD